MRVSKVFLLLVSFFILSFCACEDKPASNTDEFLQGKELIYFSQESDVWKAKIKDLEISIHII